MNGALTGTGELVRLLLRRDRIRLAVWLAALAAVVLVTPSSFAELFPTEAARAGYAAGIAANPALLALQGPVFGTDLGALAAARLSALVPLGVALLSVLTVVRHTRAEEEAGRRELLGAGVVGRHAGLAAALLVVGAFDVLLAAVVAGGLVAGGLPVAGSIAFGAALAGAGLVFAGVAAVAAQLTEGARAATGIALAVLGGAVLLRAAGDAGGAEWLSWLSPLGWAARVRPFTGERWEVLALSLALTVVLVAAAVVLQGRRDLAAGAMPARPGPAGGGPAGPVALAWRLQRGTVIGWTAGFVLAGAAFGGIAQGIGGVLDSSPDTVALLRQLGGGDDLADVFLAAEFGVLGLAASAAGVAAALRLRAEETAGSGELVLATAVSRGRWAGGHLLVALLGPALALLGAGLAAGIVRGAAVGDVAGQAGRLAVGALVQLPAVWVLVGLAMALTGLSPRLVTGAWAALVACVLLGLVGPLVQLPQWLMDASPFAHLPETLGSVDPGPLAVLVAVAAALAASGFAGLRHRDVG